MSYCEGCTECEFYKRLNFLQLLALFQLNRTENPERKVENKNRWNIHIFHKYFYCSRVNEICFFHIGMNIRMDVVGFHLRILRNHWLECVCVYVQPLATPMAKSIKSIRNDWDIFTSSITTLPPKSLHSFRLQFTFSPNHRNVVPTILRCWIKHCNRFIYDSSVLRFPMDACLNNANNIQTDNSTFFYRDFHLHFPWQKAQCSFLFSFVCLSVRPGSFSSLSLHCITAWWTSGNYLRFYRHKTKYYGPMCKQRTTNFTFVIRFPLWWVFEIGCFFSILTLFTNRFHISYNETLKEIKSFHAVFISHDVLSLFYGRAFPSLL